MSDELPAWMDDGPPANSGTPPRGNGNGRPQYQRAKLSPDDAKAAQAEFAKWLNAPSRRKDLLQRLPARIPVDNFIEAALAAAKVKPDLLLPALRESLLAAVEDAADDGLLPDGKEGALIPRWDSESKSLRIVWQPMVWGVMKLGRETGAVKSMRAHLVFEGETFRFIAGDEDRIEHEINGHKQDVAYAALSRRDANGAVVINPDGFIAHLHGAYCIFVAADGTEVKRFMTRARLVSLRDSSRAKAGPWNSPFLDEMFIKAVILYTSKWINLDSSSTEVRQNIARFQTALLRDMHVDFATIEGDKIGDPVPNGVGRIGFETKLEMLERVMRPEKVGRRPVSAKREPAKAKPGAAKEAKPAEAAQGASEARRAASVEKTDKGPPKTEVEVRQWYDLTARVINTFTDEAAMDKQLAGATTRKWLECVNSWYPDIGADFRMLVEDRRTYIRQLPRK